MLSGLDKIKFKFSLQETNSSKIFPLLSTVPSRLATIVTPESRATSLSIPVPTNGDSGFNNVQPVSSY